MAVILSQNHFRRRPPTIEMLDAIDLDTALDFYRGRFADAGDFTFTFVGSFDLDAIRPLVETYLGSLPSAGREETWRDVGVEPPEGTVQRTVHKGLEPKGRTTVVFGGSFEFERENRYVLQSTVDVLRIMLRETLREDMGGTYGVSVGATPVRDPKQRYSLRISFGADPERLGELTEATFATIDSLATFGASEENLAKVKETQLRRRETDLKENGFWLSVINYYDRHGEDLRLIMDYDSLVEGLTAEAIGEAADRYLRTEGHVQVSLVPDTEVEPTESTPAEASG
jgi:zinc protease